MWLRIQLTLAVCALSGAVAIAVPSTAAATTTHCANLRLAIYDTGPVQPPASRQEPVTHLTAAGLTCGAATRLLKGATVTITGGGGNLGPGFGAKRAPSPAGWRCTLLTGYWAAKDHADTLDWISGWSERCRAARKVVTFDEGTVTAYRVRASSLG